MSKKFLVTIFLVSIAFNLAFIGTFAYLHFFRLREDRMPPAFHQNMPANFRKKLFVNRKILRPVHEDFLDAKFEFLQSLFTKDFDHAISQEKLDITIEKQTLMERKMGELLIKARERMTPEEIKRMIEHKRLNKNRGKLRRRR